MNNLEGAKLLGFDIEEIINDNSIKTEKRYNIFIQIVRDGKTVTGATQKSKRDIIEARNEAIRNLGKKYHKRKEGDLVSIKGLEITLSSVPINTVLSGKKFELQPISSRWLTPEELENLTK